MRHHRRYWFKPARFGIFAGYYPVTWQGWLIVCVTVGALAMTFWSADWNADSLREMLFGVALPTIIILLIFDIIAFRTGEYPSWWKK